MKPSKKYLNSSDKPPQYIWGYNQCKEDYKPHEAGLLKALRELIAFDANGDRYKKQMRKSATRIYDLVKGE